eukprot:Opistho-2@6532
MGHGRLRGALVLLFSVGLLALGGAHGGKVALVIPDGTAQFNLLTVAGCKLAMLDLYGPGFDDNCVVYVVDVLPSVDMSVLRSIAQNATFDHVVLQSFWYESAAHTLALDYTNRTFSIIDVGISSSDPDYRRLRLNLQGVTFAEDQGGYMAGVVAGLVSASKRIAVVGGLPIGPILKFVHGFFGGVNRVCPECLVFRSFSPSFSDDDFGRNATDAFFRSGGDVVFGAAGLTGTA